jgi:hypothetical protein
MSDLIVPGNVVKISCAKENCDCKRELIGLVLECISSGVYSCLIDGVITHILIVKGDAEISVIK